MVTRRETLGLVATAVAGRAAGMDWKSLEARGVGRLGVCVWDPNTGRAEGHRMDERFAMCSTFKLLIAALVLREMKLDETIAFGERDLVANSPVAKANVGQGRMTIAALAEAAQKTSDNTAANLLLAKLGGPAGFTTRLRKMGDRVTRLDRTEPAMNHVMPGDERDTTTPRAMAQTVAGLTGMERLMQWMVETETGKKRIRAGLPAGWKAGDKTGTMWGDDQVTDKYNDVAVVWVPRRKEPWIITAYWDTPRHSADPRDEDQAVLADAGRIAAKWIGSH